MGGWSGKGCTYKKPSAPCLMGKPPESIQRQPAYSTNTNAIVPEKTQVAGLTYRSHLSLNMRERARLQYILLHTLEILQCGVLLFQTILNNVSCFLKQKKPESFFPSVMK